MKPTLTTKPGDLDAIADALLKMHHGDAQELSKFTASMINDLETTLIEVCHLRPCYDDELSETFIESLRRSIEEKKHG